MARKPTINPNRIKYDDAIRTATTKAKGSGFGGAGGDRLTGRKEGARRQLILELYAAGNSPEMIAENVGNMTKRSEVGNNPLDVQRWEAQHARWLDYVRSVINNGTPD